MQKDNPIPRVKCVVDTCTYYETGNLCAANTIEIRPPNADTTDETDCGTFKKKQ